MWGHLEVPGTSGSSLNYNPHFKDEETEILRVGLRIFHWFPVSELQPSLTAGTQSSQSGAWGPWRCMYRGTHMPWQVCLLVLGPLSPWESVLRCEWVTVLPDLQQVCQGLVTTWTGTKWQVLRPCPSLMTVGRE